MSAVISDPRMDADEDTVKKRSPPKGLLFLVFIGYVVIRAVDRVYMKRVTNSMQSPTYNLMLWNVIYPISRQVVQLGIWLPYIWTMRQMGHTEYTWRFLFPGNPRASSTGAVSVLTLGLFSLGDQLCNCLQGPAGAFISQTMLSVMSNTNIVFALPLSAIFLGTRFSQVHYAGCILVLLSVLVGLSPALEANDCSAVGIQHGKCLSAYKANDGTYHQLSSGAALLWYCLFLLSVLPYAAGSVYKQYVLQGRDVEVVYATWWSGCFQILWGLLCVPFLWIKLPGQDLAPGDTLEALVDTWACLCGQIPHPGDEACATSPSPLFWFFIYLFFCVSFQVLCVWLTKYLSAVWTMVASVLCLDLTNVFGMIPFLAGGGAQVMSVYDWLATVNASVAIWVYSVEPETRALPERKHDDDVNDDREVKSGATFDI